MKQQTREEEEEMNGGLTVTGSSFTAYIYLYMSRLNLRAHIIKDISMETPWCYALIVMIY